MLVGIPPFYSQDIQTIYDLVLNKPVNFYPKFKNFKMSENAMHLIAGVCTLTFVSNIEISCWSVTFPNGSHAKML
jgi:hypothetical protein